MTDLAVTLPAAVTVAYTLSAAFTSWKVTPGTVGFSGAVTAFKVSDFPERSRTLSGAVMVTVSVRIPAWIFTEAVLLLPSAAVAVMVTFPVPATYLTVPSSETVRTLVLEDFQVTSSLASAG